jgi:hypothetical protein
VKAPLLSYHHFAITLLCKVKKVKEVICVIAFLAMRYRVKASLLSKSEGYEVIDVEINYIDQGVMKSWESINPYLFPF